MNQEITGSEQSAETLSTGKTLYEELGGSAALDAITEEFYRRVTADPELKPFFDSTDMSWIMGQQKKFLTQILGGPAEYDGQDMKTAHAHLPIEGQHFAKVAEHLVVTLQSMGVKSVHIASVISLLAPLEPDIVNSLPEREEGNNDGESSEMTNDESDPSAEEVTPPIGEDVAVTVEVSGSPDLASEPVDGSSDTVAAAVEEMVSPIKKIARNASQASEVIANEVKELANETTRATEDINQKIETIRSEAEVAVGAICQIVNAIKEINDISSSIKKAVDRQTEATNEIARTVGEAINEVNEIAENIGGVSVAAKNTCEGAIQTLGSANELQELSRTLMGLVSRAQDN